MIIRLKVETMINPIIFPGNMIHKDVAK